MDRQSELDVPFISYTIVFNFKLKNG